MRAWGIATLCVALAGCTFDSAGGSGGGGELGSTSGATAGPTGAPETTDSPPGTSTAPNEGSTSGASTEPGTTDGPVDTGSTSGEDAGSTGPGVCPDDWAQPGWTRRRRVLIDNATVGADLTDIPLLLRLNANRIDYQSTQDAGQDLRLLDAQGAALDFEIESWNESGDSFVWVRVPVLLQAGDDQPQPWLYYGNAAAPDGSNRAGVWSNGYVSVHHLGDFEDSTNTGHDGFGANLPTPVSGLAGPASMFDGSDDFIELPQEGDFDFGNSFSVMAFIRVSSFTAAWQAMVTKGDDAWRLHRSAETDFIGFGSDTSVSDDNMTGDTQVNDGQWHQVAITLGSDRKRIYVDGAQDASAVYLLGLNTTNAPVLIGENAEATGRFFHGVIDEVRISSVRRTTTWLAVANRSMRDQGLISFGPEESCE